MSALPWRVYQPSVYTDPFTPNLSPSMTGRQVAVPGLCLTALLRFTAVASTAVRLGAACFVLHTGSSSSASPSAGRTIQSRAPSSSDGKRSSLQITAGCLPVCATLRINLGHHRGVSAAGNPPRNLPLQLHSVTQPTGQNLLALVDLGDNKRQNDPTSKKTASLEWAEWAMIPSNSPRGRDILASQL